jgi:hypothetical protein
MLTCAGDTDAPKRPAAGVAAPGGAGPSGATAPGSIVAADSLANTRIGGPFGTVLAYRFRAAWTGEVRSVRFFVIRNTDGRTGYSGGTGGVLRVALAPDSGGRPHVPARRALAAATLRPPRRGAWPRVRFDEPARVVEGRYYHVVFTNLDPAPQRNYVSINALVSHGRRRAMPPVPDGLAVLLGGTTDGGRTPTRWHPRAESTRDLYVPIIDVAGGRPDQHLGVGYMEVWISNPKPIGGDAKVRQLFRADAARAVTGAWLRVRRRLQTSTPLQLRIERADGGVLASGRVAPRAVNRNRAGWVHVRFRRPVLGPPGERLALTAAAAEPSSYEVFAIRQGTEFGFDPRTVFSDGHAEFRKQGAWVGWDQWGGSDQRNGDLQFALDTVASPSP